MLLSSSVEGLSCALGGMHSSWAVAFPPSITWGIGMAFQLLKTTQNWCCGNKDVVHGAIVTSIKVYLRCIQWCLKLWHCVCMNALDLSVKVKKPKPINWDYTSTREVMASLSGSKLYCIKALVHVHISPVQPPSAIGSNKKHPGG